jgi:hypothetical protein
VVLTIIAGAAHSRPVQDFSGVWVLNGLRSRVSVADPSPQIVIQVQQHRKYLTAIEVTRAGQRSEVLQRQYSIRARHRAKSIPMSDGIADQWTLATGGRELRVKRRISGRNGRKQEYLVFRRATDDGFN